MEAADAPPIKIGGSLGLLWRDSWCGCWGGGGASMVTGAGVPVLVGKRTVPVPLEGLPLLSVVHVMLPD